MKRANVRNQDRINENSPTIVEAHGEKESAISIKDGPNLDDMELAQDGESGTIKGRGSGIQNQVLEESEAEDILYAAFDTSSRA